MNIRHCCQFKTRAGDSARRPASRLGPGGEVAGWIIPSLSMVLVPKCPACVAAYLALATGIGISLPAAAFLRLIFLVACVASLGILAVRRARRMVDAKTPRATGSRFGKRRWLKAVDDESESGWI